MPRSRGHWSEFTSLADLARNWTPPATEAPQAPDPDPGRDFDRHMQERRRRFGRPAEADDGEVLEPGRNGTGKGEDDGLDVWATLDADCRKAEREVEAWNAAHPVGTPVVVFHPGGPQFPSSTKSPAYRLADIGIAVVDVDGPEPASCYPLSRVRLSRVRPATDTSDALPAAVEAAAQAERPGVPAWAKSNGLARRTAIRLLDELVAEMVRARFGLVCGRDWDAAARERLRAALCAAGVVCNADVEGDAGGGV